MSAGEHGGPSHALPAAAGPTSSRPDAQGPNLRRYPRGADPAPVSVIANGSSASTSSDGPAAVLVRTRSGGSGSSASSGGSTSPRNGVRVKVPLDGTATASAADTPAPPAPAAGAAQSKYAHIPVALRITVAIVYGVTSGSMTFLNKAILTTYHFDYPLTVLGLQMATSLVVLLFAQRVGWTSMPPLSVTIARRVAPLTVLYMINVFLSLSSLSSVNIPMYNVLKRLAPFLIMCFELALFGNRPRKEYVLAVAFIVLGAAVAGLGDAGFSMDGYALAIFSCFSQAAYLVYVQHANDAKAGLSAHGLVLYQSILSLPLLAVLVLVMEYPRYLNAPPVHFTVGFMTIMGSLLLLGSFLNFLLFLCTMLNSALTTTIVGVVKGVASTVLGMFILNTAPFSALNTCGIVMNCAGVVYFSSLQWHDQQSGKRTTQYGV